jgi:hypothetical protein
VFIDICIFTCVHINLYYTYFAGCHSIFLQIIPQLCSGLFSLLETLCSIDIVMLQQAQQQQQHKKQLNRNTSILNKGIQNLTSTLCHLLDSPPPFICPLTTLLNGSQIITNLLSNPLINTANIITISISLVRCTSDSNEIIQLSSLPHRCLLKANYLLRNIDSIDKEKVRLCTCMYICV